MWFFIVWQSLGIDRVIVVVEHLSAMVRWERIRMWDVTSCIEEFVVVTIDILVPLSLVHTDIDTSLSSLASTVARTRMNEQTKTKRHTWWSVGCSRTYASFKARI